MSEPEASAASTERRGAATTPGHRGRGPGARRTDSAAAVDRRVRSGRRRARPTGRSPGCPRRATGRARTRAAPTGRPAPAPWPRRRAPPRGRAPPRPTRPGGAATVIHPSCSGRPMPLRRPRVGADAEQPGALVDADQRHPTAGERDRAAAAVAAAFGDEVEELGLLVADTRRATRARRPGAARPAARPTLDGPAEPVVSTVLPSTHASHHRPRAPER